MSRWSCEVAAMKVAIRRSCEVAAMKVAIRSVEREGDRVTVSLSPAREGEEGYELLSPNDAAPEFRIPSDALGLNPLDFDSEIVVEQEWYDADTGGWVRRFILRRG
jgi:hypothetical protein